MYKLKLYLLIGILSLLCFSSVLALQYKDVCNDNQTLNKFMNFTACENVTCIDYNFTQNVDCPYGCEGGKCNESTLNQYLIVGLILTGIVLVIIIIIKVIK